MTIGYFTDRPSDKILNQSYDKTLRSPSIWSSTHNRSCNSTRMLSKILQQLFRTISVS